MGWSLDRIVKNGRVLIADDMMEWDIGIKDGRIARLAPSIPASEAKERPVDAGGCWVLPGVVDAHVHLNEPGMGHWEGFAAGSSALAAGGVTTYIDMPLNGLPPTVDLRALELKLKAASEAGSAVDYALWGGLVPGNLDRLEELHRAGVAGFKAFLSAPGGEGEEAFREVDDVTLFEGMARIAKLGGVLALHAESESITSRLGSRAVAEGRLSARDFAASRPVLAEVEAVGRALLFAEMTGCAVHFVHISSASAVERIHKAREHGLNVSVETCPHYLALKEEDMEELGPVAKCAPPLRSEREQEKLWDAVRKGRIDLIASDHSPCPTELKTVGEGGFFGAWGGISGAQSTLELMVTEGTLKRGIPLSRISRMLSYAPARRFGLYPRKGAIAVGADADLVLLDPNRSYTLQPEHLLYRHRHSPYIGYTFGARVTATLCRGVMVYELDRGILAPGKGTWLRHGGPAHTTGRVDAG
ncbi:allantoinase AllB [Gorillibacterium sp. sgz5001074]|uniref:allantoinase AllB n=1 Tax=Gorillibacterium sp. sgz5001074 TaxID=3446695 RepID=UPI003F66FF8D